MAFSLGVACYEESSFDALGAKDARIGAIIETYCIDIR